MDKNIYEMKKLNNNVERLNLITMLGIVTFLRSSVSDDKGKHLLKASTVLVVLAIILNGIDGLITCIKK